MSEWIEARLKRGASPAELYADVKDYGHRHHFWDEPWWPRAYVVRLHDYRGPALSVHPAVDHVADWDPSEDAELYGELWGPVRDFFEASSEIAARGANDLELCHKLIHCLLNARGFDHPDEIAVHERAARLTRRYMRRQAGRLWRLRWSYRLRRFGDEHARSLAVDEVREAEGVTR